MRKNRCASLLFLIFFLSTALGQAAEISSDSKVGDTVTNPVTNNEAEVVQLMVDPVGTPTQGDTAFVIISDKQDNIEYAILVKEVGEKIYNNDDPPIGFEIVSKDTGAETVQIKPENSSTDKTGDLKYQDTHEKLEAQLNPKDPTSPVEENTEIVAGAAGTRIVKTGQGGSNGHFGTLLVPPGSGGSGAQGGPVDYENATAISTSNQIGIEAGSVGGVGGKGGGSYVSMWSGGDGGNGGLGGDVAVKNGPEVQVAATGDGMHGIFAYSRSGAGGAGGESVGAPGGGTGGNAGTSGAIHVNNLGNIITTGDGASAIYGLSTSGYAGGGGSQWGIVGESGGGGSGANGGPVSIANGATGTLDTSGDFAHGILAQSIGGSGGSSGVSGNLILSLQGKTGDGGDGDRVAVSNEGAIGTSGDYSRGIFAQSIGGGGGSGGGSYGLVALGGSTSGGGSGDSVTVSNAGAGTIKTTGVGSDAIFAQSVGGSGGTGSGAIGWIAVGGAGANGGDGGAVTVDNHGAISTTNNGARGIVAQSVGGGGGDGGSVFGVSLVAGTVAVGGSGSGGGDSSTVTVRQAGGITTEGTDAKGILAQSVGGGGGNGGIAASLSTSVGVSVGGAGGGGGAGGDVDIVLQGKDAATPSIIRTDGDRSTGLFAQSVGGGGGTGGVAVQLAAGMVTVPIAVGGTGGEGGEGGTVRLSTGAEGQSNIQTGGSDSAGVMLQSVGGGGGDGGLAVAGSLSGGPVSVAVNVGVGGTGGSGGAGGQVDAGAFGEDGAVTGVGFDGDILTTGERSFGFLAQSVGGGGGNGGVSVAAGIGGSAFFSAAVGIGVGGSGAGGGDGGKVSVSTQGNITTKNSHSIGMIAQSVGGGGGNGGGTVAAGLAGSGGGAATVSVAVGGSAGVGSRGGEVKFSTGPGTISTAGENSNGIVAQSVGGGGGNGGFSVGASGAGAGYGAGSINVGVGGTGGGGGDGGGVIADLRSDVKTSNVNSTGILVQSVGGGGGSGGFNVSAGLAGAGYGCGEVAVGVGGSGGEGGVGGTVKAASTGVIETQEDNSGGFVAQSIGGGGGNGGFNVAAAGGGAGYGSGAVSVGIGGTAGTGNHGGAVTASKSEGNVKTSGDKSIGVLAQSVGGGGGNGGFNVSAAGSGAGKGSGTVSVGLGGSGGSAGDGGEVSLAVENDVSTEGGKSTAVVAQSVGGGGGSGGFDVAAGVSGAGTGSGTVNVGLGGSGGAGGSGGNVEARVTGDIDTQYADSGGFLAQSVGGGGGSGGFNVAAGLSFAEKGSGAVSVGLGGAGGDGGVGGDVDGVLTGSVATRGDNAVGFAAQSIGGGGGAGGFNVSGSGSGAKSYSGAVSVGLGGGGGVGNDAGAVTAAASSGMVTTEGADAVGVLAQSVGGGGGHGGFNVSVGGSGSGDSSVAIDVGLGGSGGVAGDGNNVKLNVENNVGTMGENATAVVAQSVGGGGGNGGFNITASGSGAKKYSGAITVGLGGAGGAGGSGGNVAASVAGDLATLEDDAGGFLAQSVGGGGGSGGFDVAVSGSGAESGSGAITVSLGGKGGDGGVGGDVDAFLTGTVATRGDNAIGFAAQSIGGGGGNGGFNVSAAGSGAKEYSVAVDVGLGGFGGAGNDAGVVKAAASSGPVTTEGDNAIGILAQSVGGGGGHGGFNVSASGSGSGEKNSGAISVGLGGFGGAAGIGDDVDLTVENDVNTTGRHATAVVAQSIGGGGGAGGFNISASGSGAKKYSGTITVGLGGFGDAGSNGGKVAATVSGDIGTLNEKASGVVAQSVGGGGGDGGFSIAGAFDYAKEEASGALTASVGGFGGAGGSGGDVTLTRTGDTITFADKSRGVVAQSIGGGGGNGGFSVSGFIGGNGAKDISASVGGFGGPGSGSGAVKVSNTGDISTGSVSTQEQQIAAVGVVKEEVTVYTGRYSDGILAQSIGGGGGDGGFSFSGALNLTGDKENLNVGLTLGGFGGSGGTAGGVAVDNEGLITTMGAQANGIVAQSIGGGGGNGGSAVTGLLAAGDPKEGSSIHLAVSVGGFGGDGNTSGNVTVDQSGSIMTYGPGSNAILAQSIAGGGGNGGGAHSLSLQLAAPCSFSFDGNDVKIEKCDDSNEDDKDSYSFEFNLGGMGGAGNDAGTVTVVNHDLIATSGKSSAAILAQSIGGGGGNGGQAVVGLTGLFPGAEFIDEEVLEVIAPLSTTKNLEIDAGGEEKIEIEGKVTIGGASGASGSGGAVSVTNNGDIVTSGDDSPGIFAQSIGGGGGIGGDASSGASGALSIGGWGKAQGNGGDVTVVNKAGESATASIATTGVESHAIFAQSVGGGGGKGGMSDGFISIGGFEEASGNGGKVEVRNEGVLSTEGFQSIGIFAQSVGGGGGAGGGTGESTIAIGGMGGMGGDGNLVKVDNAGQITTSGDNAFGIFGQSVGGSGGFGGANAAASITIGGFGGNAGNGGDVDITTTGIVSTSGIGSDAIRGQSVGGGGGVAGGSSEAGEDKILSIGGSGGGAGNGGLVAIDNANVLLTTGDMANGIYAQSVGGGGGSGGQAMGGFAIGGFSNVSGDGGEVRVTNRADGAIWTKGAMADGIYAQSVGGGGGNAGVAYMEAPDIPVSASVGGLGGAGGDGGNVTVDNFGMIQIDGPASEAIFAQSVGGGGGNGGITGAYENGDASAGTMELNVGGISGAGGKGGVVTVTNRAMADIFTNGANSTAIFAQSVGGGGGRGGSSLEGPDSSFGSATVSLGGIGGSGGDGDKVTVQNEGNIVINGDNSIGIMAQSVGGGGGSAESSLSISTIPIRLGGQDGIVGKGGDVTVTNTGSITIAGNNSIGIFAQSVGGGGGLVSGGGTGSLDLQSGGDGDGGEVVIDNATGSITVSGNNSVAMYLQSVGGGGGAVGGLSGESQNNVARHSQARQAGISAQSVGQLGAFLFSGSAGGQGSARATRINQTGDLIATGDNSVALIAQSDASGGKGDITVNILNTSSTDRSVIKGGGGQGAGLLILNGANNSINNDGIITNVQDIDGFAMRGTTGDDHIINKGLIIGSVDMGGGANSLDNKETGDFHPGDIVNLGDGTLTNEGLLLPGDYDQVFATELTGSFKQTSTGVYGVDLDLKNRIADSIVATNAAEVSGTIPVNLIDPANFASYALPGLNVNTLVSADDGAVNKGISLQAPNTAVSTYSLDKPNATDINLNYVVDYSPAGLTKNQQSVGSAINRIQLAQSSPAFRPVSTALFFQPDTDTLGRAYDTLSGEETSGALRAGFHLNDMFRNAISHRMAYWISDDPNDPHGLAFQDDQSAHLRKWRLWVSGYGQRSNLQESAFHGSSSSVDNSGGGFSIGVDWHATPNILFGVAGGFGWYSYDNQDRDMTGNSDAMQISGYGGYQNGNFYATGIIGYDHFENKQQRHAIIPSASAWSPNGPPTPISGFNEYLSGEFDSHLWNGYLEVGYKNQFNPIEVTPFLGLQYGGMKMDGFTEFIQDGNSQLGLSYSSRTNDTLPMLLGVQLKAKSEPVNDIYVSAMIRTAWQHEFCRERSTESSFISAPGFNFVIQGTKPPADSLRASLGLNLSLGKEASLYGIVDLNYSDMGEIYSGTAGVRFAW